MAAGAAHANNSSVTPTTTVMPTAGPTITPVPSANATVTPVPTPGPRQVFSTPKWDINHVSIIVDNNGGPISIVAWIENSSNKATISVGAGESMVVSTPSIQAENGQIVKFGFLAYENDTPIDSYNATITVMLGPTPTTQPQESVTISGTIVDADNGTPISGASITFKSITYDKTYPAVVTAADGTYTSPKMYPDAYSIRVTASGYQSTSRTSEKITGDSNVDSIGIKRIAVSTPPTPTPAPNLVDVWANLLYNPALCLGTLSAFVAIAAGSIGIYEWLERKRNARKKKEKEEGEKKP
jgi:hypothetical protein